MSIDTVLFDLDGTVADSLPLIKRTYKEVFQEMHIPWGDDEVMKYIGLPLRQIGGMMAGLGKEEEFFETYQRHYRKLHDQYLGVFPGTREMLTVLREKGFSLGLVTSKSRYGAEMTLSLIDLGPFFSVVVTVDDTELHKPHPDPVLLALEKLKKAPPEAIFVGDSPFDIGAGNRAGVTTIAVTWGMAVKEELLKYRPSFTVDTREELLHRIEELGR
ncbi:HAD family hydrolase [Candidatus Formimonas warabiya]|uniref:HAD-IA family hydrolase n=1 Tax=Formimonas warabiya TaxID=1761012 RepID=A0A3G1KW03_FORW1|nr:HAD-IA family hydrolase [Candidatus Formimonas warabiya]ATW26395.1 hypothetical protein DCMF_17985 [Candidatus Formimonas warabiya]